MPAPALPSTIALPTLRDDLVFTESRLLADDHANSHARTLRGLITEWDGIQSRQLQLWDDQTRADALVGASDDALDDFIVRFAAAIRTLPGSGASVWALFFKVPPHELASPVLGDELEALRRWAKLLVGTTEAPLKGMKKELDALITAATDAVKARTEAAIANDQFRTHGDLAKYLTSVTKKRDAVAAALDALAASDNALPRDYSSRFFRRRRAKVSADEKQARAEKRAAAKQAKDAAAAAVKAAKAKVKAAIAELKAAKKK